eukprot:1345831-Rhodomonas_salina.1
MALEVAYSQNASRSALCRRTLAFGKSVSHPLRQYRASDPTPGTPVPYHRASVPSIARGGLSSTS